MPPPDTLTDTMITGRIKTALLSDPGMNGADVSVQTNKGVVTLVGTVKSHEQTGIASAHAQRQDGVVRVDSDLALNAR
jgi:hyperosmotically inducible protein